MAAPGADAKRDKSLEWNYGFHILIVVVIVAAVAVLGAVLGATNAGPHGLAVPRSTVTWVVLMALLVAGAVGVELVGARTDGAVDPPSDWLNHQRKKDEQEGQPRPGEQQRNEEHGEPGERVRHGRGWKTWRLWVVLVLLAVPTAVFGQWARPSGPNVIRLELAGSQEVAATLFCANRVVAIDPQRRVAHAGVCHLYPNDGVIDAAFRADIGLIVGYVLLLFLLVRWAGSYYRLEPVRRARVPLSWAVVAAGGFDLAENLCLWRADHTTPAAGAKSKDLLWELAATCAWVKFAFLLTAVGFVVCGVWTWWFTPRWVQTASWNLPKPSADSPERPDRLDLRFRPTPFGIALSGGGIRAACISLGALQMLETDQGDGQPIGWDRASVVTAVSGGSNMASGWSLARSFYDTDTYGSTERLDPAGIKPPSWSLLQDEMTREESHLFANLGYLLASSPRGTAGSTEAPATVAEQGADHSAAAEGEKFRPSAIATALAGFALNVAVFVGVAWAVATPFGWMLAGLNHDQLHGDDYKDLVATHHLASPGLILVGAGAALLMVWVLLGQYPPMSRNVATQTWRQALFNGCRFGGYSFLVLGAVLLALLTGLPYLAGWLDTGGLKALAGAAAGAAGVAASVARILRKPAARFAPYLGGVAFAVFAVIVAGAWVARAARLVPSWQLFPGPGSSSRALWLLVIALLAIGTLFVSPERWSLAAFYRGKLRIAYGTYRTNDGALRIYQNDGLTSDTHLREPWLHSFRTEGAREQVSTPLTVCGTATVSTKSVKTHYAIPALSVTFDPRYVTVHVPTSDQGEWAVHQAPTEVLNAMGVGGRKRLTTMMAVAISSAAVSPAMGRIRIGPTSMLLAFANVRLGLWMPNPRYANAYRPPGPDSGQLGLRELSTVDRDKQRVDYPRTGLGYLFKEFLGIHDLSDPYLYMTDGGHWENTGLVEMLRRGDINEVVCIDADCGSLEATSSLGKALDLAPLECGVHLQVNLDPLRVRRGAAFGPGYAERTVTVGFFRRGPFWSDAVGVLWYSKPGLTADMSAALLGFREMHPDFPVVSTSDQFFDSSTYVAYRELGRYNGACIRAARAQLVEFLEGLKLPDLPATPTGPGQPGQPVHPDAKWQPPQRREPVDDPTRDRVLAALNAEPEKQTWVARELADAARLVPLDERVWFLVCVKQALSHTAGVQAATAAPASIPAAGQTSDPGDNAAGDPASDQDAGPTADLAP